ncbi:LuxR family transcriptional regulator [Slackia heliotrinireducens]|uniref:Response regulator containing a CheY-like receiver domain and an HTH DNA-binding domain n=1 Tax=Slackia heliotrinireducens (strain ATCC 29202 / DSM 20476 / NCTC 11029 / RHS 1) TaxID=471855 RepID=C7N161_SLAHD|nr:LuxR family transcriptional regulator [Slackia heliotrinireducens]ACV23283.1 response regulator containing a CheY-like receiver domain and an HTH DNA-binding domain [Slackia heliotrinireducens DSM 20476]VEH02454.1 transcriptional regulator MalT [Slackia heliotrinireducens]
MAFRRIVDKETLDKRIAELSVSSFLNARILGFAFQRAWVFLLFLGAASSTFTLTGEAIPPQVYMISSITLCCVLFAAAMREEWFLRFNTHPIRRWMGPVLTVLGTLCAFLMFTTHIPMELTGLLCGILTGLGSGIIDLGYGEIYRNVPPDDTHIEIPVATFYAACIYATMMLMPPAATFMVAMVLPLASAYVYLTVNHVWEPGREPSVKAVPMQVSEFTWRIGACAFLVGTADSLIRQIYMHINHIAPMDFYQPGMILSCLVMMTLLVGYHLLAKDGTTRAMYKFVMFIMAFFILLLPVLAGTSVKDGTFALISYNCFNVIIWMVLAETSYTYRLSSMVVFGVGWGMVTLGVACGQIVSTWVVGAIEFTPQAVSLAALVCTLMVLWSYLFILREDDMIDITKMDEEDGADEEDGPESPSSGEGPQANHPTPFKDRCKEVAEEYGLTPRETEVMMLFAKGRTSARIQEELVLSRGTVTTHLQHIYQKMDVHTKQEFLDKIERK